jgi:WD40 repeat protein
LEDDGAIRIYDPSTGKVPNVFNGRFSAFSPDGKLTALLYYNQVEIHQTNDGKLLHRLQGNFVDVDRFNLRFAPDGQSLAGYAYWSYCCAGYDGRLSLWRVLDGALLREMPFIGRFDFSPDGKALAVADNGLQIWNTTDGSVRIDLKEIIIP